MRSGKPSPECLVCISRAKDWIQGVQDWFFLNAWPFLLNIDYTFVIKVSTSAKENPILIVPTYRKVTLKNSIFERKPVYFFYANKGLCKKLHKYVVDTVKKCKQYLSPKIASSSSFFFK